MEFENSNRINTLATVFMWKITPKLISFPSFSENPSLGKNSITHVQRMDEILTCTRDPSSKKLSWSTSPAIWMQYNIEAYHRGWNPIQGRLENILKWDREKYLNATNSLNESKNDKTQTCAEFLLTRGSNVKYLSSTYSSQEFCQFWKFSSILSTNFDQGWNRCSDQWEETLNSLSQPELLIH